MKLKRLRAVVLGLAIATSILVVNPAPASAATCVNLPDGWFTFRSATTGKNWRADPYNPVRADGDPAVDPWNQLFILCQPSNWGLGNFRIYSNTTGRWLQMLPGVGGQLDLVWAGNAVPRDDPSTLFFFCNLDGNFLQIRHVQLGVYVVPWMPGAALTSRTWPDGHSLYHSNPRLNERVPHCA